jgi:parallel beta-helix repeat protein
MRILLLVSLSGLVILGTSGHPTAPSPPLTFHVARGGDDRAPGTKARPFATIQKARDTIRVLKKKGGLKQPVTVLVHGGTYRLSEPLILTPEDSGTSEHPITYAAFPGETPTLSGARVITGWKETTSDARRLWKVDLPEVRAGKWTFHQLWVNGQRRTRARHPNEGFFRVAGLPDVTPKTPWNQGQQRFRFSPGDLKRWSNPGDIDVVAYHLWVAVRLAVKDIDEKEHLVTFVQESRRRLTDGNEPARYRVENAPELLDAPGEWYLDRKSGTLSYLPEAGEKLAALKVTAPRLPQLLRLEGNPGGGKYVSHVVFRGLTFADAEWWPARNDPVDVQAAATVPAVIHGDGVRDCVLDGCTVAHASGYGLHLARGCQDNRVIRCEVFDLGAGGLRIGETAVRGEKRDQTHGNIIEDNHLHALGKVFPQAVGVWIGQSYGNRVAHNHIHDLLYTGISCGWTWGYGRTLAHDNIIEQNRVHDVGKGLLSDMGGIYTLGIQKGTVIRNNVFHDIEGHRYGGWGIYLDEGSSQIVVENNLAYRTTHGGFHQHYGKENIIRNNIFAFGKKAQIQRTRVEPHRSFSFERNIVYYDTGDLLAGRWDDDGVTLDHNLYWKVGGKVRFGKWTWAQWRAKGRDQHSLIADPLFVAPMKGDFRLKPMSPADRIDFHMPDLTHVGPRKE